MPWQPVQGRHLLTPFGHQVAGKSSLLGYDATTVCKPVIPREHFVYKTLPQELEEFTTEYRGEIEVELEEKDGYIQLYGIPVESKTTVTEESKEESTLCSCSSEEPGETTNKTDSHKQGRSPKENGKEGCVIHVLPSGSYEVSSSSLNDEFYSEDSDLDSPTYDPTHDTTHTSTQSMNPWSMKAHNQLLDKMRKAEQSHNSDRYILLKNIVRGIKHPCVLDLKIGSRLHGDDATDFKVDHHTQLSRQTTSGSLGVRLAGMQVYQADSGVYKSYDKYYGRMLDDGSLKTTLCEFFHNGLRFQSELLPLIMSRVRQLICCLQGVSSFRFYCVSLLIIYSGEVSAEDCSNSSLTGKESRRSPSDQINGYDAAPMSHIPKGQTNSSMSCLNTINVEKNISSSSSSSSSSIPPCHNLQDSTLAALASDSVFSADLKCHNSENIVTETNSVQESNNAQCTRMSDMKPKDCNCLPPLQSSIQHAENAQQASPPTQTLVSSASSSPPVSSQSSKSCTHDDNQNNHSRSSSHMSYKISEHHQMSSNDRTAHSTSDQPQVPTRVDVKMIDFAHTTHSGFVQDKVQYTGPDLNCIAGLQNLLELLKQLQIEN